MDKPLKEHIQHLEVRLEKLNALIMRNSFSREEVNRLEADIRVQRRLARDNVQERGACFSQEWDVALSLPPGQEGEQISMRLPSS